MKYLRFGKLVRVPLALAVLLTSLLLPACQAGTNASSFLEKRPTNLSQVVSGIIARSAQVKYITEQDSEVFAFYRNTPVKEISDATFLELIKLPSETRVIRQPWAPFFQLRVQNDPTGRWKELREYLEANLTNLTIIKLPRESPYDAQYDLYAIGVFEGGLVVGVQMFGVAT